MKTTNYYNEIKNKLIDNEINKKVKSYSINRNELDTYYEVGKILNNAGKHYGEGIIKNYSIKLISEVDKKYNETNLKRMRQFYWMIEKGAPLEHQLSWSHYKELIPIKNINAVKYYIDVCRQNNITRDSLREKIKSKEYERLPEDARIKLVNKEKLKVDELIKEPILIKNRNNYEVLSEKVLQRIILEDIPSFLKELGDGFTFVENEYKIKMGSVYNYIDLLLFNYRLNCFVVVELKVTELKKEYIGQIQVYMNYIDSNLKNAGQDKTIGIIIVKMNNRFIMKYCSDDRIKAREYAIIK